MFFRTKTTTSDYCREKLERLFSKEHERALCNLRNGEIWLLCGNEHLHPPDGKVYLDNVRAAIIQLMRAAVAHSFHWKVVMDVGNCVADYLGQQPRIYPLFKEYNSAFGRSSTDGVALMVELFADKFPASVLAQSELAKTVLHDEFYKILKTFTKNSSQSNWYKCDVQKRKQLKFFAYG